VVSGGRRSAVIALKVARCLNYVDAGIVIIDRWACVLCGVSGGSCFALSFGWCWVLVLGECIAGDCIKDENVFFLMWPGCCVDGAVLNWWCGSGRRGTSCFA